MTDLIAELGRATEGSLELDATIAENLGWKVHWATDVGGDFYPYGVWGDEKKGEKGIVPRFTTSLDAALTLVPEPLEANLQIWRGVGTGHVYARANCGELDDSKSTDSGIRPSPALALCIAALKARQAQALEKETVNV